MPPPLGQEMPPARMSVKSCRLPQASRPHGPIPYLESEEGLSLLRSGCGARRGGYFRSLRHPELGQYRRDVVVDGLR